MITISLQQSHELAEIDILLDSVFGSDRQTKSSYLVRGGVEPAAGLSFVARDQGALVGTLRFWSVEIVDAGVQCDDDQSCLLLGPLAIDPSMQGIKLGARLMKMGLDSAQALGYKRVLLVGAHAYYEKFGFKPVPSGRVTMPDGKDGDRLLYLDLGPAFTLPECGKVVSTVKQYARQAA